MTSRRNYLAEEYIQNCAWLPKSHDGKLEMDCFKAGYDARSKDVEGLVEAIPEILWRLSDGQCTQGEMLLRAALAEFEGEKE